MMHCHSSRFGEFDIRQESVLTFPTGLLGFPESHRFVILDHDTDVPFKWLQSLDEPGVAFVVIDPALFHASYHVDISSDALNEVKGVEQDELILSVLLTIPSDDPTGITANLRGPVLMNLRTKLCKQLVLSDEYPTRYPLFPAARHTSAVSGAATISTVSSAA
jgi:flagellar assembly factor FliW